ncbi:SAM-dependent methyltransferase [Priestia megaterium]|uniref:class I SAM-dependent methyltransferase n=1 Tax=Priestia megaterium TaxID=1404 RepID=UPI000BF8AF67|nr:class I SAM-dependent methyltransferase [Priestia megaterium]MBM6601106.1 methyltransferase domain-containing protein [Priestia megaterium]MBV6737897.1 methyltransferase domain-containing protein [Priestia megaterium]MDP1442775.1 methyltransferase domain-containing protein [Priestia megaterium]MDP1471977.1 methyltransferase domain-containing protein [Priestia megaterium]PFO18960.1 SAM-dependent methyltransferase [Priestia megaterium]
MKYMDMLALLGVGGAHPGGLHLTKQLLEKEEINIDTSILDIGCGTGQTSAYLYCRYGCEITACDINATMVQKANKRFEQLKLPCKATIEDIEDLSFDNESFDIILLESVAAFTNISSSLKECKRVLKKGGIILAIETVKEPQMTEQDERLVSEFYHFQSIPNELEWVEYWKKAGFSTVVSRREYKVEVEGEDEEQNIDFGTEFDLSDEIPSNVYDLLDDHERLTKKYQNLLGFRIFRCIS